MIKSLKGTFILSLIALLSFIGYAASQEEDVFYGTVIEISDDMIVVEAEDEDGNIFSEEFAITENTKFFMEDKESSLSQLEVDDEVEVYYEETEDAIVAIKVIILK